MSLPVRPAAARSYGSAARSHATSARRREPRSAVKSGARLRPLNAGRLQERGQRGGGGVCLLLGTHATKRCTAPTARTKHARLGIAEHYFWHSSRDISKNAAFFIVIGSGQNREEQQRARIHVGSYVEASRAWRRICGKHTQGCTRRKASSQAQKTHQSSRPAAQRC